MTLSYHNGVSIAEIVVYVPALSIAIFLAVRHGFGRSSGWLFLIIFCLARIIGSSMQLATISQPRNISLYTGSAILQNIGLSPLELAAIGLLSRLQDSINRSHHTSLATKIFKLIEIVILVGLILGIVGGINASDAYTKAGPNGVYQASSLSKASTSLFIVSYIGIVVACIFTSFSISHAEHGEKRILIAVALSLPFILVRLIYSILSTFTHNKNFNLLNGNVTVLLCVALIEEFVVVVLYEGCGLTLHQIPKAPVGQQIEEGHQELPSSSNSNDDRRQQVPANGRGNMVLNIAKKTIIGRLVMAFLPSKTSSEVELRQHNYVQK